MTKQPQLLETIEGLGTVYTISSRADNQVDAFRKQGIKYPYFVSVRQASFARLHGTKPELGFGTRTCHAPILAAHSPVIVAKKSPILRANNAMLKQAIKEHVRGEYTVFGEDQAIYDHWNKIAEEDKKRFPDNPEKRRAMTFRERGDFTLTPEDEEARFLFEDQTQAYFQNKALNGRVKVYQIDPKIIDSINGTLINYVWFSGVQGDSGLSFGSGSLGCDGRSFGVLASTKGAKPLRNFSGNRDKQKAPYTPRELSINISRAQRIAAGTLPLRDVSSEATEIYQFLNRLKS